MGRRREARPPCAVVSRFVAVSLTVAILVMAATSATGAPLPPWHGWDRLIGDWIGGPSRGVPGPAASSGFSFRYDLENHVVVRKDWADYAAMQGRPSFHHEGLMVVNPGDARSPARATYYDNEGHVIEYDYAASDSAIVFVSVQQEGAPRYRLTYRFEPTQLGIVFEIAQPGSGDDFKTYVEGTATRVPPAKN